MLQSSGKRETLQPNDFPASHPGPWKVQQSRMRSLVLLHFRSLDDKEQPCSTAKNIEDGTEISCLPKQLCARLKLS